VKLEVGRRYRMRNGTAVYVIRTFDVKWVDQKTKARCRETLYLGQLVGHHGDRLSWHANGSYSPLGLKHQLDIVKSYRKRK
jgi:hypothetical protein